MEIVIAVVASEGTGSPVAEVLRELRDRGTHGPLRDGWSSEAAALADLAAIAREAAGRAALRLREVAALGACEPVGEGLTIVTRPVPAVDVVAHQALWDSPDPPAALSLVAVAEDPAGTWQLLYQPDRPCLGPIPPCTPADLAATWITLAGGKDRGPGRYLLEEAGELWDPDLERQLTERLRQLYGE